MTLPPGFLRTSTDGADLVLRNDVAGALVAAGLADPESLRALAKRRYRGRGEPFGIDIEGVGAVFVRPYLHGGAFGRLTGDRFASDGQFVAELNLHVSAAAAHVPVCEALGIVSRSAALGMRRGWILLREIAGARDLLDTLCTNPTPRLRRAVLRTAGAALRALHDGGFEHPDLHLKNLLVADSGASPRVLVVDLDSARWHRSLPRERRIAGLFRFDRYAEKQRAAGRPVTRTDRMRVLRAYAGADWPARADLRELTARLRAHIARHRSSGRTAVEAKS